MRAFVSLASNISRFELDDDGAEYVQSAIDDPRRSLHLLN